MIIRTAKRTRFLVVDAVAVDDTRLSFAARGLLCYLLNRPDDWKVRLKHLADGGNVSEYKIRQMLKELREAGYARLERPRKPDGTIGGTEWIIYESTEIAKSDISVTEIAKNRNSVKTESRSIDTLPNTKSLPNTNSLSLPASEKKDFDPVRELELHTKRAIPMIHADKLRTFVKRPDVWEAVIWEAEENGWNMSNVTALLDKYNSLISPKQPPKSRRVPAWQAKQDEEERQRRNRPEYKTFIPNYLKPDAI